MRLRQHHRKRLHWLALLVLALAGMAVSSLFGVDTSRRLPNCRLVAIGINDYGPRATTLKAAVGDAKAIAGAFQTRGKVKAEDSRVLLDSDATRAKIMGTFQQVIDRTQWNDLFVMYFAGIATSFRKANGEVGWYLLPADFFSDSAVNPDLSKVDEATLETRGISAKLLLSWCSQIQANHQLILLDADNTQDVVAQFATALSAAGDHTVGVKQRRIEILGAQGIAQTEPATKDTPQPHGFLTRELLKGLAGPADAFPRDGFITAKELNLYVSAQLLAGQVQELIASANIGEDFDVATGLPAAKTKGDDSGAASPWTASELTAKFCAPGATQEPPPEGKYYALLIATDHYYRDKEHPNDPQTWPDLLDPVFTANKLKNDLHTLYGFEEAEVWPKCKRPNNAPASCILEDRTFDEIWNAFDYYKTLNFGPNDELVIFISGHGYRDTGDSRKGYLVTKDAKSSNPHDRGFIFLNELAQDFDGMTADHILVIIDSCYSGDFGQGARQKGDNEEDSKKDEITLDKRKEDILRIRSRVYLTSGGDFKVPAAAAGELAPFNRKLIESLEKSKTSGYVTFGELRARVAWVDPQPTAGAFGVNAREQNQDFIFVAKR